MTLWANTFADGYTGRRITLAEVQEVSVENLEGKSRFRSLFGLNLSG
jgi:hypothetical protein